MEEVTQNLQNEDVVAKYKRLLSLARSSLEANQVTLVEKDKQINQLKHLLEEERSKSNILPITDDENENPKSILRRIDIDNTVWILFEYHGHRGDSWMKFKNEGLLYEFIHKIPGVPLEIPPRCLTPAESLRIVILYI
jgi:hypothetical protein